MKKIILGTSLSVISLYAYTPNKVCKTCHPIIYKEFTNSAHKNSSIFSDKIHKAIWDIHPNKKKGKYTCNTCHTPNDKKIQQNLSKNTTSIPTNNKMQQEGISCLYCHSIKQIKQNHNFNTNILEKDSNPPLIYSANKDNKSKKVIYKEEKSFFGLITKVEGSPYHNIDYSNENFYNGNMCMGCHSHFINKNNVSVCKIDIKNTEKSNCISCHMPKIPGSATTIKITKTHTFHGFAGAINYSKMLAKYIKIETNTKNNLSIKLSNLAPHDLFLQPLRLAELRINVIRNNKKIFTKNIKFKKLFLKDNKPTTPWYATHTKTNILKANETREFNFDIKLQKNDNVEIIFGYYLVNPKIAKKLKLDSKFITLKQKFISIE